MQSIVSYINESLTNVKLSTKALVETLDKMMKDWAPGYKSTYGGRLLAQIFESAMKDRSVKFSTVYKTKDTLGDNEDAFTLRDSADNLLVFSSDNNGQLVCTENGKRVETFGYYNDESRNEGTLSFAMLTALNNTKTYALSGSSLDDDDIKKYLGLEAEDIDERLIKITKHELKDFVMLDGTISNLKDKGRSVSNYIYVGAVIPSKSKDKGYFTAEGQGMYGSNKSYKRGDDEAKFKTAIKELIDDHIYLPKKK